MTQDLRHNMCIMCQNVLVTSFSSHIELYGPIGGLTVLRTNKTQSEEAISLMPAQSAYR